MRTRLGGTQVLYGSGLFNFGSHLTLFAFFLGFDIPTSLLEMFFIIPVISDNYYYSNHTYHGYKISIAKCGSASY